MCFGQTFFDGVISFENGAGVGDFVDSFDREGLMHSALGFAATRVGNVIKIDDPSDTAPPGEGPAWIWPRQRNPFVLGVIAIWDNPISVFSCRLSLDGSPGTRVVSARLGWSNTSVPPNHHVGAYSNAGNPVLNYLLPTTVAPPLRITVLCPADFDDGTGTGTPDLGVTIDDLLFYLTLYADASPRADLDNGTTTGTPDGGVTTDDLLYYLARYELGC